MAIVRIPDENRALTAFEEVKQYLADIRIDYERWNPTRSVAADAPAEELLAAYAPEIERLKAQGSYVTASSLAVATSQPGAVTHTASWAMANQPSSRPARPCRGWEAAGPSWPRG